MLVRSHSPFLRKLEHVEAMLGIVVAGAVMGVCGIVAISMILLVINKPHDFDPLWKIGLLIAIAIITTALILLMLRRLALAFEKQSTHATYDMSRAFAGHSRIGGLLWGALALVMALAVLLIGRLWGVLFDSMKPTTDTARAVVLSLNVAVVLGAAYASNGYVLCFLRGWRFPGAIVKFVYRYRYLLDVIITIAIARARIPGIRP